MTTINMIRKDKEIMTAEEYLKLRETNNATIKSTRIIPGKLGANDFGKIEVTYRSARYVME